MECRRYLSNEKGMTMFRCKQMPLAEWSALQAGYDQLFTTVFHGDQGMALFIESDGVGELDTLLIPAHNAAAVEALSPGGWADCPDATDRHWALLVGNADAWDTLGLPQP